MDRRVRLVYEAGVEFTRELDGPWYAQRAGADYEPLERDPSDFEIFYVYRPVFHTDLDEQGLLHDCLLSPTGNVPLSQRLEAAFPFGDWGTPYFDDVMNLLYMLESAFYHCIQLADAYTRICKWHSDINMDLGHTPVPRRYSISAGSEALFEFDALVTSLRRVLESARYLLWHAFGESLGTQPRNFERTLDKLEKAGSLPSELSQSLRSCWESCGTRVKDYRDCVLHFIPLDPIGTGGWMDKHDGDPLLGRVDVPDNPQAKSASRFKYEQRVDALGFGWTSLDSILTAMEALLGATLPARQEGVNDTAGA